VPFWNLLTGKAEDARHARNSAGKSGSSCPRGILAYDREFSDYPICTASRRYHKALHASLKEAPVELRTKRIETAEAKACLCGDLAGSAQIRLGIDPEATPLICPGPNSVYFNKVVSFNEMVGHVYGRNSVLPADSQRPHVFLNEFELYLDFLEQELREGAATSVRLKYVERFKQGLEQGLAHLRELVAERWIANADEFLAGLGRLEVRFHSLIKPIQPEAGVGATALGSAAVLAAASFHSAVSAPSAPGVQAALPSNPAAARVPAAAG